MFFINKNKYEDIEMVDLEEREDICDIFIRQVTLVEELENTVGLIANKELVSYIADELFKYDWTSPKKVDFDEDDLEYMVSVNGDGYVVAMPVTSYKDEHFTDIDTVYISQDGDVTQSTINECVNTDKEVILFGLADDSDCDCYGECDCKDSITTKSNSSTVIRDEDGKLNGFSATWSDNNDDLFYSSSYSFYSNDEESVRELAKEFGVNVN